MKELTLLHNLALTVHRMREVQRAVTPGELLAHRELRRGLEERVDALLVEWLYMEKAPADPAPEGGGSCPTA